MEEVRPTVLVVDDDMANLRTFQRVFRRAFRILLATSAEEALEAVQGTHVDIAFIDYTMPRINGLTLLEMLHERDPSLVCYLLTGYSDLPEITAKRGTGLFRGVLSKPWDRPKIEQAVAACFVASGVGSLG